MNTKEITLTLKSLGWRAGKDEVGDRYAHRSLADRTVQIIYGLNRIRDRQQFASTLSLTTEAFARACATVDPRYGDYAPFIRAWKGIDISAPEILEEHVRQASDEAIAWAQKQDLDKALREHAALPTNAPGARPIWHLAALALVGDVKTLRSYQASFEAGDRLGFVPYVTKDFIDRAVALAADPEAGT